MHVQAPSAALPMMTHMELYASTFFPGYPPHVQQLLARQASRAMGLRSHYTEVVHRDDPPLSGPPPPLPYPPHQLAHSGAYGPSHQHPPHMGPPRSRPHGMPPQRPPPPGGYGGAYGPPPPHMQGRHPAGMPPRGLGAAAAAAAEYHHRFGKKPMRGAPMSMRDEDAELRFVMSRLAPSNKNAMRMPPSDQGHHHHHPLLSPNAPVFTPHEDGKTKTERAGSPPVRRGPLPRRSSVDLVPTGKRSSRSEESVKSATKQTSVFAQSGKPQSEDKEASGKDTLLSPTSPEFVPTSKSQRHDVTKANAVQTVMKLAQERANHEDGPFPQEQPMKRDLKTPAAAHDKDSQRQQPYDHPPKNPSSGMVRNRGGVGGPNNFADVHHHVHHPMDGMSSPYMPPPGFGGHLRGGHGARVTPDMTRYPSLRSMTMKESHRDQMNRFKSPLAFDKRYRGGGGGGDRYGNWRSGARMMGDERIQEVIDARQMVHGGGVGGPSLRDVTNIADTGGMPPSSSFGGGVGKDAAAAAAAANMKGRNEDTMISRFDTATPPPFLKKNPTINALANNKSRFGGPAAHPPAGASSRPEGPGQQSIISLAEQNIGRVVQQQENIPPPPPNDASQQQDRRRVTYKEARPTLRDLSREARARHERSPENAHNYGPSENVFVRTGATPQSRALAMPQPQSLPVQPQRAMHSPPGLPAPHHRVATHRQALVGGSGGDNAQGKPPQVPNSGAPAAAGTGADSKENAAGVSAPTAVLMEMADREHRDNHRLRGTYQQAQHHHHFTPRSRELRIRDRIAAAEHERREAAMRVEARGSGGGGGGGAGHHSPRSMQADVRERSADRLARDEGRGRSREPDISDLCERYAIRNECRYGVDTCRYEHVKARDLTDAELDAIYERRRERKAQRKRELEKYRYADERDRYESSQRGGGGGAGDRDVRSRRSRSPSYDDDDDRRGPPRRPMMHSSSPPPPRDDRRRYNDRRHDRDHRRGGGGGHDRRGGGDENATPARTRGTAYPMPPPSSVDGSERNRRSTSRSNPRERDERASRPNGRGTHVRGTARARVDRDRDRERDRDYHQDRVRRDRERDRSQRDRAVRDSGGRARDSSSKARPTADNRDQSQKENNRAAALDNLGSDAGSCAESTKSKKEKREPSREGALTDIRLAPRENKDEVCRFFGTDKPCWAGERCPFQHVAGAAAAALATKDGSGSAVGTSSSNLVGTSSGSGSRDAPNMSTQKDAEKSAGNKTAAGAVAEKDIAVGKTTPLRPTPPTASAPARAPLSFSGVLKGTAAPHTRPSLSTQTSSATPKVTENVSESATLSKDIRKTTATSQQK